MLKDNLLMLRTVNGMSQEDAAGTAGVSRQAYAKWEKGDTVPDIEKCAVLARHYGVTIDALMNYDSSLPENPAVPGPAGKHIFGSVTVGEKGQIVIPRDARELFEIAPGDRLIVLADEHDGIALMKMDEFEDRINRALETGMKNAE